MDVPHTGQITGSDTDRVMLADPIPLLSNAKIIFIVAGMFGKVFSFGILNSRHRRLSRGELYQYEMCMRGRN